MSYDTHRLTSLADQDAWAACEDPNKLFHCYDKDLVAEVFKKYSDFAILPSGAIGHMKLLLDEETRRRPATRLAKVFQLDPAGYGERNDFADCAVNLLRVCAGLLTLWLVLRKRNCIKDDVDQHLIIVCATLCFVMPTNFPTVNLLILFAATSYILNKQQSKQPNLTRIKLLLGLILCLILSGHYTKEITLYQSFLSFAPFVDSILAFLQTCADFRTPLYSSVIFYYFGMLITYRSCSLLKCAWLYYTLGELDTIKLIVDIVSLYLYAKFFAYLKATREDDSKKAEVGVTRALRLETRTAEEVEKRLEDKSESDVELLSTAENESLIEEKEEDQPKVVLRKRSKSVNL